MTLIIRSVNNPRNIPCPIRIPGYDATLPIITVAPSATLDLLSVITEDNLVGVQDNLNELVDGGALNVTDTIDTATFEEGYAGTVTSLHADSDSNLTGDVQLVSGSHITLSQVGQAITVNATGELSATLTHLNTFAGDVSNVAIDNSVLQVDVDNLAVGINTTPIAGVDVTVGGGSVVIESNATYAHTRFEPVGILGPSNPAWESGFRLGNPYYSIVMDDGTSKTTFVDFALNGIVDFSATIAASAIRVDTLNTMGANPVITLNAAGVSALVNSPVDQIQLQVQGSNPQTADLFQILKFDNTPFLTVSNLGLITLGANLDMGQHQLINAVIESGTSEPGSPIEGQIFYRSDTHQAELWNGSSWVLIG